jgi:hypothetical protein
MHSHAFRWFSATPLVFLFLGLLPLQLYQIWRIFCVMYGEEYGWTLFVLLQNYISLKCLNGFLAIFNFDNIFKKVYFSLVLVSSCKQLQENQAVAWILKTKEKNPPKQESLVFLEMTVHRVGEKAENQRKTREKSKVAENQVFWLDFCAK